MGLLDAAGGIVGFFKSIFFPSPTQREMKRLVPLVAEINSLEPEFKALSDDELKGKTALFRNRLARGENLDMILPEAFASVREAARRVLGQRHFDCQLIGGAALHRGVVVEMKTGEGKTLVSTLPGYLNALTAKGVHLVTVNEYLARRDSEWMGQIYRFLGISVGLNLHGMTSQAKRAAYDCDIVYGTNNEFGFDYLRDNMCHHKSDMVQREHYFAVVDEVDSVLIDEARTPLIISGPAEKATKLYQRFSQIAKDLSQEADFTLDEKTHGVSMTDEGIGRVEKILKIENLYDPANTEMVHQLQNSLKARFFYKRDKEYVVKDGEVIIVDEHTGRLMVGRRYSDGLHQAIEAKENVRVEEETVTLASITFQNYFRLYQKLSGMTGTADTEAKEFAEIYGVPVIVIPTNVPVKRTDHSDLIYRTMEEKFEAIVETILERHKEKQPLLVGTRSIEMSEFVAAKIRKHVPHVQVLNAKYHEREAEIVAQAGRLGAVTIATNMAGRGTDIVLGGNPEFLAREKAEEGSPEFREVVEKFRAECATEKQEVLSKGGLFILGTERHDSRRIDNQLRGRSGRQGDPGESQFFLSLEDEIFRLFGGERLQNAMAMLGEWPRGEYIQHPLITYQIENAQKNVENHHFEIRKNVLKYDDVMNVHRTIIYKNRRQALEQEEVKTDVHQMIRDLIAEIVMIHFNDDINPADWDEEALIHSLHLIFPPFADKSDFQGRDNKGIAEHLVAKAMRIYQDREASIPGGGAMMRQLEKMVLLQVVDQKWKAHLQDMEILQEGIHLRAWGQRDPLVEFKREASEVWGEMIASIREDVLSFLFRFETDSESLKSPEAPPAPPEEELIYNHGESETFQAKPTIVKKTGRNTLCDCGSGKKFKHCHGQ